MSDIAQKVKQIIIDKLGVEESEVTPEASFTFCAMSDMIVRFKVF